MDSEHQALRQSAVFATLDPDELSVMAGAMRRHLLRSRQTVFEQDCPGDSLFVLAYGTLAVRFRRPDQAGLVVDEMKPGAVLGEMACLDPAPRTATVDVVQDSIVYELERNTLLSLRQHAPQLAAAIVGGITTLVTRRLRAIDELLHQRIETIPAGSLAGASSRTAAAHRRMELSARLDPSQITLPSGFEMNDLELLQGVGHTWVYDNGVSLCTEDEAGASCFILLRGELEVLRSCASGPKLLAVLAPGTIAGQMALVDRAPRSAELRARGRAAVVELDRDAYDRLVAAASPFALSFQEQIAVAGIRQLRTAIELLKKLPDPGTAAPDCTDEQRDHAVSRYLTGLKEWSVGMGEADEISFPEVDEVLQEATRVGS